MENFTLAVPDVDTAYEKCTEIYKKQRFRKFSYFF